MKLCMRDPIRSEDKAKIYKIPLTKQPIADGVFNSDIFKPNEIQDQKVVMVMGATGVGKTTIINRMINYIFGVNYTDPFRFQLKTNEAENLPIKSRTSDIQKYTIHHRNFPYKLSIIDTPGICSTKGKKEDKKTLEKIRYLFESGTIEVINAICIVENYNKVRLTEKEIYVFKTITEIFGKDVCDVIAVMATCCDDIYDDTITQKPPPVLRLLEEQQIPFKTHYLFNNKDIYTKPIINPRSLKAQVEAAYWNTSTNSFRQFFANLESTPPISLKLTKDILQTKYNIKTAKLPYLVRTLRNNIHEIETLEQDRRIIEKMITNPDTLQFTKEINVTECKMIDIDVPNRFSTICEKCDVVCHYPCDIQSSNSICTSSKWCTAMTWFNTELSIHCTVCRGKCSWTDHKQVPKRQTFKTHKVPRTIGILKWHYMRDMEAAIEVGKKTCEDKMVSAYKNLLVDFKEIQQCIDYINQHSLSKHSIDIHEFIQDVIESEEEEKEDGYKQRIHCLKRLVEMRDEDTSSDEVQQAIILIQSMEINEL